MTEISPAAPPVGAGPHPGHPRRTAILTALACNVVPLALVAVAIVLVVRQPADGEDWRGVIAAILLVFGTGAVLLSAALGAGFAAWLVTRRLRATTAASPPSPAPAGTSPAMGRAAATGWGALSAALGWLVLAVAYVVIQVVPALVRR